MSEPQFVPTDPTTIEKQTLEIFQSELGRDLYPAQLERLLADIATLIQATANLSVNETGKQNLVEYATGINLDELGKLTDTPRLISTRSSTVIRFTLSAALASPLLIPKGTVVTGSEVNFSTRSDLIIGAGLTFADAIADADLVGEAGNGIRIGELNQVNTEGLGLPSGVELTAANLENTSGGYTTEPDQDYRERIKLSINRYGAAGSQDSYRFYAMSVSPSILDVDVISERPCFVTIYLLTSSGTASSVLIGQVLAALNDEKVRPVSDVVTVASAVAIPIDITIQVTIRTDAVASVVRASIESITREYATELSQSLSAPLIRSQLQYRIFQVEGIYNLQITSPPQDVTLSPGQFIKAETITVSIVGIAS